MLKNYNDRTIILAARAENRLLSGFRCNLEVAVERKVVVQFNRGSYTILLQHKREAGELCVNIVRLLWL